MSPRVDRVSLRTPRLTLMPFAEAHAAAVWAAIEPSLEDLRPWLVWTRWTSERATAEFVESCPGAWRNGSGFSFAVLEGEDLIGSCSLAIHNPNLTQGEIGYWLRSDRAGNGYTTEAARAVRDFGFDATGCHRLNLRAGVGNVASQRVAEKIGFTREG
ncbi:MAG TPA: GNAT family N-acetyltransferase, partial [Actinomycetota bacterium]|nr:GNAT family N-acetyltransferase [Actinomycetota bacterium]